MEKWGIERMSDTQRIKLTLTDKRKGAIGTSLGMGIVGMHIMGTLITPNYQPMQIIRHQMETL